MNLRHLHAYINHPLLLSSSHHKHNCFRYSCLGDISLLPLLLSAIPIASAARTALARAGLRNICSLKVLHEIAVNQVFGERLDATARSLNDYFVYIPTTGVNDYFVYFLVTVRGTALRTSSCIDVVRLHQTRPIE